MKRTTDQKLAIASLVIGVLSIIVSIMLAITTSTAYLWITIGVLLLVISALVITILHYRRQLKMYRVILENQVPLYGLMNYLHKRKIESDSKYLNKIKITSLTLATKLVGQITQNKDNDMLFTWIIEGTNIEDKEVSCFYFRIAGETSIGKNDISIEALDCSTCPNKVNCTTCKLPELERLNRKMLVQTEHETRTYRTLKLVFTNPIKKGHSFSVRISYIWPQCYNSVCDYLLIDPNNFSTSVDSVSVKLECDGTIVDKNTHANLAELDRFSAGTQFVKKLEFKDNCFSYTFSPKNKKIYYIVILNADN